MPEKFKVFDASHAPREEVDGVMNALREAGFDVYEVGDNLVWGGGAICVKKAAQQKAAREVVEEFQRNWRANARTNTSHTSAGLGKTIAVVVIVVFVLLINILLIF